MKNVCKRASPRTRASIAVRNPAALLIAGLFLGAAPAFGAGTFSYADDFETDAAMIDSWRHSPFVLEVPDILVAGVLHYEPVNFGRGLGFYEGFAVDGWAFLEYEAIPAGSTVVSGTVEFLLFGEGTLELWGSVDGASWFFLDSVSATIDPVNYSLRIEAGDPSQFVSLRGFEHVTIDDLRINIDFVPLPGGFLLLAPCIGLLAMMRIRLTRAACK